MAPEIITAGRELSPIIVAFIGAIAGLISGIVASFVSPWVHYTIETRKKSLDYKISIIREVRALLDKSSSIGEIQASSLWGFIEEHLNEDEHSRVLGEIEIVTTETYYRKKPKTEPGTTIKNNIVETPPIFIYRKAGISQMLTRLEKEWQLVKA